MEELFQKAADLETVTLLRLNYQKTVLLLRALKAGAVGIESVRIDGDNWNLVVAPQADPPTPEGQT